MSAWLASSLALVVGVATVLQGHFNSKLASGQNLGTALFINNLLVMLIASVFLIWSPLKIPTQWQWSWLIPGLCGFTIVAGIAASIPVLGPAKLFVLIVSSQLVSGLVLEWVKSGQLGLLQILGAALCLGGVMLASLGARN